MSLLAWILAVVLVLTGLVGVLLPALPGAVLVLGGLTLAAWADGFSRVGPGTLALLVLLTVLFYVVDFGAGALGSKRAGASGRAVWGAALGTVVGIFFGLPGILLGPFVGAVAGEYSVRRRLGEAGRAGAATWIGLAVGTAAKVALVFTMLGIFAAAYAF